MSRKAVKEIFIPAGEARAFVVDKGRIFRIVQVEEKQVADVVLFNANDYKETFHAGHSIWLNCIEKVGNIRRITKLYSNLLERTLWLP